MPADLLEEDTMFYAKENGAPWHGLGTPVDEAPTSAEAIKVAGLDWNVELLPMHCYLGPHSGGKRVEVLNWQAVVRHDTGRILGAVRGRYTPIQNVDIFRFLDELVASGDLRYETAGSLLNGSKVWILARVPDVMNIGGDKIFKYLLGASAHDGSSVCRVIPTTVRVVCHNTWRMAWFARDAQGFAVDIRHMGNIQSKLSKAREILGLSLQAFDRFQQFGEELAAVDGLPILPRLLDEMFPRNDNGEVSNAAQEKRDTFVTILNQETVRTGEATTAYDLFNASVGYADHVKSVVGVRGGEQSTKADRRFISTFWAGGDQFKTKAVDAIATMAEIYSKMDELKVPVKVRRGRAN